MYMFVCGLVWFYGISTKAGYLLPNLFLYINSFYIKQFSLVYVRSLNLKNILLQAIQFSRSMQFKCQNSSISNNSV